jgi:Uma2 family endonuclease
MPLAPVRLRSWTRREYERLVELGVFHDEAVELIGGQLVVAEPQDGPHATAVGLAQDALTAALPRGLLVRGQMPIALDDKSEPEPDVAVVPGTRRDYIASHPARPVLAIEVADSRLAFDRGHKGSLYARAGIPDYWIVNLVERLLEIHRDPAPDPAAPFGWRYRSVERLAPPATAAPLAVPGVSIPVADLLP